MKTEKRKIQLTFELFTLDTYDDRYYSKKDWDDEVNDAIKTYLNQGGIEKDITIAFESTDEVLTALVHGYRYETDEELTARLQYEEDRKNQLAIRAKAEEDKERAELARLLAKYGDPTVTKK